DQAQRVGAVVDREGALQPGRGGVAAQDAHAGAVEGGDPHGAGGGADQLLDALAHLGGGLGGGGDREDLAGQRLAGAQQVGDAAGEPAGPAVAGAGDDQQRAAPVLGRRALGGAQPVDEGGEGG